MPAYQPPILHHLFPLFLASRHFYSHIPCLTVRARTADTSDDVCSAGDIRIVGCIIGLLTIFFLSTTRTDNPGSAASRYVPLFYPP
jgi:hypothetical protein